MATLLTSLFFLIEYTISAVKGTSIINIIIIIITLFSLRIPCSYLRHCLIRVLLVGLFFTLPAMNTVSAH